MHFLYVSVSQTMDSRARGLETCIYGIECEFHQKCMYSFRTSGVKLYNSLLWAYTCSRPIQRCTTLEKAMDWCTAQWKMLLFCVKTIMKESRKFELACLKKKKKKEKHFGRQVTFWFGTFAMLFSATGSVVRHENTRRWTVGCYNGL